MKTLNNYIKESILDDEDVLMNNANKYSEIYIIEKWCKEHDIYSGHFKVNSAKYIEPTDNYFTLILNYEDYDELPKYINFAGNVDIRLVIGKGTYMTKKVNVKSFRGLPNICSELLLRLNTQYIPDLNIKLNRIIFNTTAYNFGKFNITFFGDRSTLRIRELGYRWEEGDLSFLKAKGVRVIDVVNDFNFGDRFSKQMARKAPMNKYKNKFTDPVTDAGLEVIYNFFGKTIDTTKLEEIGYTQQSKVVKRNGKWYRCKNWEVF